MSEEQIIPIEESWSCEVEKLLAEWSEKASCWRWLYSRAEKKYRHKYHFFSIPVIILSTLTGTANFAMDSYVPDTYKQLATAVVGGLNLFAGVLSTLQNFLKVAENMESARNSCVSWGKLQRSIQIELSLDRRRRQNAHDFLKVCRAEYDRLTEQSPIVDDEIIEQFKKKFKKYEIAKPSICNGLDQCKIYSIECKKHLEENEEIVINLNESISPIGTNSLGSDNAREP